MASISLPPQSQTAYSQHFDLPDHANADSSRRLTMPAPLPNPHFVFPARDVDESKSHSGPSERPALPTFSFNSGSEPSSQPAGPPVRSNSRSGGHRRRPSEFVGGEQLVTPGAADGEKREGASANPVPPPGPGPGRGPGRRGHAHRRSAAVSGVDLNAISKALNTPADNKSGKDDTEDISKPLSQSAPSLGRPTPPISPQFPPVPTAIHIEPAPNDDAPDAGQSDSTSHKPSASITTIKIEQPEDPALPEEPTPPGPKSKPRPKTADASLAFDFIQSTEAAGVPAIKRSHSAAGHSRSHKSLSTGNLDAALSGHGGDDAHSTDTSRHSCSDDGSESSCDQDADGSTSAKKDPSKSKKKKRVRSWAGSILTRGKSKSKRYQSKADSEEEPMPSPPPLTRTDSDVGSAVDVDFDNDDVVVIRTPTNPDGPVSDAETIQNKPPLPAPTLDTSWKPRSFYEQGAAPDTLSSPVIDLDAALGPFNTPEIRPTPGAPSNFTVASQRMYSGGRRGAFIGPEMRYHRRTESAPVMPPFDHSALGGVRLGGTSTVEAPDVFYEEEEDAFLAANQSPRDEGPPAHGSSVFVSSDEENKSSKSSDTADTLTRAPEESHPKQAGLGIQARDEAATPTAGLEQQGAVDQAENAASPSTGPPRSPVEILKSEASVSKPTGPPSPDISPRFLTVEKRPATSPMELQPSIPPFSLSAGVSPSDSSFPSPDIPRSTTASSMTDRNFSSHSYHNLPSDHRYASIEDVPSLTSSASTMTNNMNRFSASFFPRGRMSTDRAASFSATGYRRSNPANASKRSSLASLSKLVGGQHSERSKLNQEEKPPGDVPEKTKKKGRRLSRLMHFWKLKDKDRTAAELSPTTQERPQS